MNDARHNPDRAQKTLNLSRTTTTETTNKAKTGDNATTKYMEEQTQKSVPLALSLEKALQAQYTISATILIKNSHMYSEGSFVWV